MFNPLTEFGKLNIAVKVIVVVLAIYLVLSVVDLAWPTALPPWLASWTLPGLWARFEPDLATVAAPVGGGGSHRHRHRTPAVRRSDSGPHPL